MKKIKTVIGLSACFSALLFFTQCTQEPKDKADHADSTAAMKADFGGFASQTEWGKHLVTTGGCGDCHTPKKMSDRGPEDDSTLLLSGHPANMPVPEIDRKAMEGKGYIVTQTLTSWIGPWGISYAANLTPDPTGLGGWTEENFIRCLREGKFKGIESGRTLLPPMPWPSFRHMTDGELKAIFAFLKTIPAVSNVVPETQPPVSAQMH
jgi:hypothetical protein